MVAICRRHFEAYFRELKYLNSNEIFTSIYFQGFNWQYASVGSGNVLAPKRWQAIIWTNDDLLYCIYAYMCRSTPLNQHSTVYVKICIPFSRPFIREIHWSPTDSSHKGPVMWSFDVFVAVSLKMLFNQQCIFLRFEMPWRSRDVTVMIRGLINAANSYETLTVTAMK